MSCSTEPAKDTMSFPQMSYTHKAFSFPGFTNNGVSDLIYVLLFNGTHGREAN